jgi:hypothetical protein
MTHLIPPKASGMLDQLVNVPKGQVGSQIRCKFFTCTAVEDRRFVKANSHICSILFGKKLLKRNAKGGNKDLKKSLLLVAPARYACQGFIDKMQTNYIEHCVDFDLRAPSL